MSKVIYLAHYSSPEAKRITSPAGNAVMSYIIESVIGLGHKLTIISPTQMVDGTAQSRVVEQIDDNTTCIFLPTTKHGKRCDPLRRLLWRIWRERNLIRELKNTLEDGDTLLVYHSLALMHAVKQLRKSKKFRLLLQVAEIYTDVAADSAPGKRRQELSYIRTADGYIFMSEQLAQLLSRGKPYAVCCGTYQVEPDRKCRLFDDDKIHCVYAGTFDPRKGGAIAAASAAEFLPEQYHMHIIGFGSEEQTKQIMDMTKQLAEKSKCGITYDGLLSGEDYIRFLQSCDIGLSTQNPDAAFNSTSFPSKILSYMANGLRVVTVRIPVVESSAIGDHVYYYDQQTTEAIAKAIQNVDVEDGFAGKNVLFGLHMLFQEKIKSLLEGNNEGSKN